MDNHIDINSEYQKRVFKRLVENPNLSPFFMTVVFADPFKTDEKFGGDYTNSNCERTIKYAWKKYDIFHRHLCSKLTNNYTKKLKILPETYDFIDFGSFQDKITKIATEVTIPHIHSIYLIHPHTYSRFYELVDDNFCMMLLHPNLDAVISVDAIPMDRSQKDIFEVIDYSSKFTRTNLAKNLIENVDLFRESKFIRSDLKIRSGPREKLFINQ
jgi:hypothetical protein